MVKEKLAVTATNPNGELLRDEQLADIQIDWQAFGWVRGRQALDGSEEVNLQLCKGLNCL